ncbi:MAG: Holliday junction resolvase RuvX, partial [Lachnospiraceae bacterium]|nr:Holliday junction resolvase RuvX [Lachnospiraceae bacterium]
MRIMGLDFGAKTVGVAISDALGLTAQGKEIVRRERESKLRQTCARIEELIVEYGVERIVMGLPKNMDGSEGDRVEKTKAFQEMLERRTGLEVV